MCRFNKIQPSRKKWHWSKKKTVIPRGSAADIDNEPQWIWNCDIRMDPMRVVTIGWKSAVIVPLQSTLSHSFPKVNLKKPSKCQLLAYWKFGVDIVKIKKLSTCLWILCLDWSHFFFSFIGKSWTTYIKNTASRFESLLFVRRSCYMLK